MEINIITFMPLIGLEYVITQLKSVILSFGLIDRHLTVEQAVLLSRLEEEYQVFFFLLDAEGSKVKLMLCSLKCMTVVYYSSFIWLCSSRPFCL